MRKVRQCAADGMWCSPVRGGDSTTGQFRHAQIEVRNRKTAIAACCEQQKTDARIAYLKNLDDSMTALKQKRGLKRFSGASGNTEELHEMHLLHIANVDQLILLEVITNVTGVS